MMNNEKLDLLLTKFDGVEGRLDKIDKRLDNIDNRLDNIDNRLDEMDERFDGIDNRLDKMDERFDHLEEEVRGIKLSIENELRPNIQRIAEGHLDLDRKLKEIIKSSTEYEMLAVRVGVLESEVGEIKRKIS